MHKNYKKLKVGQRLYRFTVLNPDVARGPKNVKLALFRCSCGNERVLVPAVVYGGNTKSCGCLKAEAFGKRVAARHKLSRCVPGSRALRVLIKGYRANAKRAGREFSLSFEWFRETVLKRCYYCGHEPSNVQRYYDYRVAHAYGESIRYSGVDRLDNTKGYTESNCVPCCKTCNLAKRLLTEKEFLDWVARVYKYRKLGGT